ncbi:PAS domain S-box protein [Nibribacter ruber]|uniref:histidine kinase n=1 Tax=Nibribacter ruber TaxID=2698458 RepID=A0A6P1NV70_9BACT|nr:PAS domain S-box protein [Nibribacter ruber]QHL86950.1 PAS domain S-box protein [Nibribacter ruber]
MEKGEIEVEMTVQQEVQVPVVGVEVLYALVDLNPEPMALTHQGGTLLSVNEALEQLLGHEKSTLLLLGLEPLSDLGEGEWRLIRQESQLQGICQRELHLRHQDGAMIPVQLLAKTVQTLEGDTLVSLHVRDQREIKALEEKLEQQQIATTESLHDMGMVLKHSADLICTFDLEGRFLRVNQACETILGYKAEELVNRHYTEFIYEDDIASTLQDTEKVKHVKTTTNFKNRYRHKNGNLVHLSWSSSRSETVGKAYCIARDITELIKVDQIQKESEERLQALLQQGSDMIGILDIQGGYLFASSNVARILGISPEDFIGRNAFEYIHPDFHEEVIACLTKVLNGEEVNTMPYQFKDGRGEWRWLESHATNCLDQPSINGIIVNTRDITDRRKAELQLEENNQRFKALFDYNPDAVYSLDTEGNYTSANSVALKFFGLSPEELQKKHLFEFASQDNLEETKRDFAKVLSGEPISSEAAMKGPNNEDLYFSFTEIPIIIHGKVVGVHGIAKDISVAKRQQLLQEATANRLNTILESIRDAFFTIDKDWRFTYINQEFDKVLGVNSKGWLGLDMREIFPVTEFEGFYQHYQQALATGEAVHFEMFSPNIKLWLDVNAYPSEEGLSIYFKEITSRKTAEAELKKLSWVASKTVNSVYITDDQSRIEWVNDGFIRVTGYTLQEMKGQRPGDLLAGPETALDEVRQIRDKLKFEEPFVQEVQNRNKNGELYWSKLDVTPIFDEQSGGKKFIVIETVITEQKKAEQERMLLTEELLRRNRHLEQFTYIVSHNLRSPVANILGLTALFNYQQDMENQKLILDRLKQTAQNLDTILRDLNDLLSMQGEVNDAREKIDLRELVEQVLQILPDTTKPRVQIELNGLEKIHSARSYVSSILSNLVSNAVKYKAPQRELQIKISAEQVEDLFCFTVEDNGLGIDLKKEQGNLFGLYKRFHFHVTGKGLGLYLVKTQAEALGGYVTVESQVGKGSSFKVYIKNLA